MVDETGGAGVDVGRSVVTTVVLLVVVAVAMTVAVTVAVPPAKILLQNIDASAVCPTKASRPHFETRRMSAFGFLQTVLGKLYHHLRSRLPVE